MTYTITYKNGGSPLTAEGRDAKDAFVKSALREMEEEGKDYE